MECALGRKIGGESPRWRKWQTHSTRLHVARLLQVRILPGGQKKNMQKNYIEIIDVDGKVNEFDRDELLRQLVAIDFPGTAPIKYAFRTLAQHVLEMRRQQKKYFQTRSAEALNLAKAKEAIVDKMLQRAHQIELL